MFFCRQQKGYSYQQVGDNRVLPGYNKLQSFFVLEYVLFAGESPSTAYPGFISRCQSCCCARCICLIEKSRDTLTPGVLLYCTAVRATTVVSFFRSPYLMMSFVLVGRQERTFAPRTYSSGTRGRHFQYVRKWIYTEISTYLPSVCVLSSWLTPPSGRIPIPGSSSLLCTTS